MEHQDPQFYRKMNALGVLTALAFFLIGITILYNYHALHQQDNRTRTTIRAILCDTEKQIIRGGGSRARITTVVLFYEGLIKNDLHAKPCNVLP